MKEIISHEIQLRKRPVGITTENDFEIVEVPIREPNDGGILVQNEYISVDPYMRGRMNDYKSYTPSFQIGETLTGGSVGKIVLSNV